MISYWISYDIVHADHEHSDIAYDIKVCEEVHMISYLISYMISYCISCDIDHTDIA